MTYGKMENKAYVGRHGKLVYSIGKTGKIAGNGSGLRLYRAGRSCLIRYIKHLLEKSDRCFFISLEIASYETKTLREVAECQWHSFSNDRGEP